MKTLIGLAAVVLLLTVCGWITFSWNGDRASVNVETDRIESDTEGIVEEGRELLEAAGRETPPNQDPINQNAGPSDDVPPAETPPATPLPGTPDDSSGLGGIAQEHSELERRE